MTRVMLLNRFTDDERWLSAGSDALALFLASLCYSDRHLTEGRILKSMAPRICLAVQPDAVAPAIDALLRWDFWSEDAENYRVSDYHDYCLPKAEQEKTQEKWRVDKARKRLHNVGNHDLCHPKWCRAAAVATSTVDATADSTGESTAYYPTRLDSTRHDPTLREGSVEGSAAQVVLGPGGDEDTCGVAMMHAYVDDGSGLYCDTCNLPAGHATHGTVEAA